MQPGPSLGCKAASGGGGSVAELDEAPRAPVPTPHGPERPLPEGLPPLRATDALHRHAAKPYAQRAQRVPTRPSRLRNANCSRTLVQCAL